MTLVAFKVVGVAIAFFGAAVILLLLRTMTMHEAYKTVGMAHPVPARRPDPAVSHAVRDTGGTDLLARGLGHAVEGLGPDDDAGGGDGHRHGGDALLPQRADDARDGSDRGQPRA